MTTSGSTNFELSRDEIVRQAALLCRAVGANATMSSRLVTDFSIALNAMVKHWQGRGLHVWTVTEGVLFPVAGQTKYTTGADHIAGTWYETTLSADEAAAQTVLDATSTTNMTALDNIGIVLDDGTIHWTTIVSKTSSTVTITAALPSAAASGNKIFNYTTKMGKPLRVVDARRRLIVDGTETPIPVVSRQEYRAIPNKTGAGTINQLHCDLQLSTGQFHLWQVPSLATDLVTFTWWRPIEDFDAGGDTPDLSQEWFMCLYYNLAAMMLPRFPVPPQDKRDIRETAAGLLFDMEGWGREAESLFFQPATRR